MDVHRRSSAVPKPFPSAAREFHPGRSRGMSIAERWKEGDAMTDRGPDQDQMKIGAREKTRDSKYRDATYLGTDEEDEEEVRDLGFIVEDHDDRRAATLGSF